MLIISVAIVASTYSNNHDFNFFNPFNSTPNFGIDIDNVSSHNNNYTPHYQYPFNV